MSAPSPPPDNSLAVEQSRQQSTDRAQAIQDQKDEARKTELAGLRTSAGNVARGNANDYFTSRGLDPSTYSSAIDQKLQTILSGIAPDDPNPGQYFNDFGEKVYTGAQDSTRAKALSGVNALFAPNFETSRVPYSLDDPYLAGIEGEQRASADAIIQNMLSRGVITDTGRTAAIADLDRQKPTVQARLNEIGTGTLSAEQQALRDIANKGRQTAQTINLGQAFDPNAYGSEADTNFNDWLANLSSNLRSKVPGSLYSTTGLGALAGIGQGAQNTPFNPSALSGDDTEDDGTSPPKKIENIF